MRFSIIVPVYNVAEYLDECIESVLSQTYQDYELILVNDGSQDNSLDICKKYAAENEQIVVINKENGGLTSARKAGAHAAKGEYVICLDGDDYLNEGYFNICSEIIDIHHPDCVCFGFQRFSEQGKSTIYRQHYENVFFVGNECQAVTSKYLYDSNSKEYNNGTLTVSIWSKAVRLAIYKEAQDKIDDSISKGEDLLLSAHIYSMCKNIYFSDFISYSYRFNGSSITHTFNPSCFKQNQIIANELKKIYGEESLKVFHYLTSACIGNFDIAAKVLKYVDYKVVCRVFLNEYDDIYVAIRNCHIKQMPLGPKVRRFLISHKLFLMNYVYVRSLCHKI